MSVPSERPDSPRQPGSVVDRAAEVAADLGLRPRHALARLADALCAAGPSREAVREAAVRYGSAARALALAPDEMVAALHALLRRCAARHAPAVRAELETSAAWWAAHGYYRAD
jgi:hypothetical protein